MNYQKIRAKVENPALMEPTFEEAMKYSESVRNFIERHPEVAEPIGVLFKQNKALGRHAGGVIVSENIAERMPVIMAKGEVQTPWVEGMSFKHLEHFGWIKFDLLGLETLRIIQRAIQIKILCIKYRDDCRSVSPDLKLNNHNVKFSQKCENFRKKRRPEKQVFLRR